MPSLDFSRDFPKFETVLPYLLDRGLALLSAVLILIIGLWVAGRAKRLAISALRRADMDTTLQGFFGSVVGYAVITITLLAVLAKFGVQTASIITILGAAGLAIGLALQGTLSNVAAGVMLFIFRPFRGGDYVEVGGIAGTVKELTLFTTELATPDNIQIIVPNSNVWGQAVKNYSHHSERRLDLIFGISYNDNIGKAVAAIREVATADPRCRSDPEPLVTVNALNDSSVDILLRIWVLNGDYWPMKFDLTWKVKERLDAEGITIPFPTRATYNYTIGKDAAALESDADS